MLADTPLVSLLVGQGEARRHAQALDEVIAGATRMEAQIGRRGPGRVRRTLLREHPAGLQVDGALCASTKCKERNILDAYAAGEAMLVLDAGAQPLLLELQEERRPLAQREVQVVILGSGATRTTLPDGRIVDLGERRYLERPKETLNILAREGVNFDCSGWKVDGRCRQPPER